MKAGKMIFLFNIPNYTIDTSKFNNLLHGDIVEEFTENFCKYVGAPYGCAINSASSAIFLLSYYNNFKFSIPTMLPPVVLNAIINGNSQYEFVDNINWIGHTYNLYNGEMLIIDSAQEVMSKTLYVHPFTSNTPIVYIYSFYPTKSVSSCDGGMICSNDKGFIDFFKTIVMNGMEFSPNSWERSIKTPGWKMYMNSIQAHIANENLKKLDEKKHNLHIIREIYNYEFGYDRYSEHLYTIKVKNNTEFVKYMKAQDIQCGIHYRCLHNQDPYRWNKYAASLLRSELSENQIVSIPYHEKLTEKEIHKVIQCVRSSGMKI